MSEADAEDGLHGLDAYLDGKNGGTILDLHLPPPRRHSILHPPPTKNKKEWETAGTGAEGGADSRGREGRPEVESSEGGQSHHARGAREISSRARKRFELGRIM